MKYPRLIPCVAFGLLFMLIGCDSKPQAVPVTGTVTYKGEPLKQGSIAFEPEKGRSASGKIVDGKIVEVTTYTLGDGVIAGTHKVTIRSVTDPDDMYAEHKSLIPEHYGNPRQTPLKAEIKPGETNELTFALDDKPPANQ